MTLINTFNGYAFYIGEKKTGKRAGERYYNIVPIGSPAPNGGYYSPEYICKIKGVPNLFTR